MKRILISGSPSLLFSRSPSLLFSRSPSLLFSRSPSLLFSCSLLLLFSGTLSAQDPATLAPLKAICGAIIRDFPGLVGVGVLDLEKGDSFVLNGDSLFPMQSVFKLPLGMAVLNKVDESKGTLEQKVHIAKADLLPDTWSPLRDSFPAGNVDITLDELLRYTVCQSDNNGCDILFRWMGGPEVAQKYIEGLGIKDLQIVTTEREMHADWSVQYRNFAKPASLLVLLKKLYDQEALSPRATDYLLRLMVETTTGPKRLKGLLPEDVMVAHKTGTSGYNDQGISPATNDIGILILPNDRHFVVVVLVTNTKAGVTACEKIIAQLSHAVYDFGTL